MVESIAPRSVKAPILGATLRGIGQLLAEIFKDVPSLQVMACANPESLEGLIKTRGGKYELPIIGYNVQSTAEQPSGFNPEALKRVGAVIGYDAEKGEYLSFRGSQLNLVVQVTMLTDSNIALWNFIEGWHSKEYWGFSIGIKGSGPSNKVNISVIADKNLSIPTRNSEVGGYDLYRMTSTLTVSSFVGYLWKVPDVRAMSVLAKVVKQHGNIQELLQASKNDAKDWVNSVEILHMDRLLPNLIQEG